MKALITSKELEALIIKLTLIAQDSKRAKAKAIELDFSLLQARFIR